MARAKGGKYAAVVGNLPRLPIVDTDRRDLLDAVKEEILRPPEGSVSELTSAEAERDVLKHVYEASKNLREAMQILKRSTAGRAWASEFARGYAQARDMHDEIDNLRASAHMLVEAFQELMCDHMEQEGVSSLKLTSGRGISTWQEPYGKVEDKAAFRDYCFNDPDLRQKMQLWPSTTDALVKEMLLHGLEPPPGVTAWAKTKVRLGSE